MHKVRINIMLPALIAGIFILVTGCVETRIEPAYIPKVATTQNNEGVVTISWQSRKDYNYRLSAQAENGQVVVDKKIYKGTGDIITVSFKRDPSKPLPDYSVIPEKLEP